MTYSGSNLYPDPQPSRIDYDRMRREYPRVRAALTRARNTGSPLAIRAAVIRFCDLSDAVGCMPDDWASWRNALEDAFQAWQRDYVMREDDAAELAIWRAVARRFWL